MTNYKQLCVELLSELENAIRVIHAEDGTRHISGAYPAINTAKNALAESEPEGPTDEEIMALMPQQMQADLAAAARAMWSFDPDITTTASAFRIILNRHVVDLARAVLACWGNYPANPDSSLQPIPVSERMPENCDGEEQFWWFFPGDNEWWLFPYCPSSAYSQCTHWLPAHALPLPTHE